MLRKIKYKEFKNLYRKHIIYDFPKSERPSLKGFRKRILKYNSKVYIYEENEKEKGYIIIDKLNECILISFLAVYKNYRGEGIGTKILKEIEEKLKNEKGIILEVEDPEYAQSQNAKNIMLKRIKFYEKSGYKIVEGLNLKMFFDNFKIMILEKNKMNNKEVSKELKYFYDKIFNKNDKKLIEYNIY